MENYAKIGLNEQQFSLVLQLESLAQQNNFLPENQLLASRTNFNVSEVGQILQSLIEQKFIEIVQTNDEQNRIQNQYSLSPLYEKLVNYLNEAKPLADVVQDSTTKKNNEEDDEVTTCTRKFEIEFGRMLSPLEREMIQNWFLLDHYDAEVIQLALREAVLAQVYNFKYIDRILLNWSRMNLKTANQVKHHLKQ